MHKRYKELRPYIQSIDSSGNLHVLAPAGLIERLRGYYKFELSDNILADDAIYADAWYRVNPDEIIQLMSDEA